MNKKTMKCDKCSKKSVWQEYTGRNYCDSHFLEIMEKRIRKNLRINRIINIKKEYVLMEDEENKHLITEYFLKKIFQNRLKIKKQNKLKEKNNDLTILSSTLDNEAEELLNYFMLAKEISQKAIKPLSVITNEELIQISKSLEIKLRLEKSNHEELTKKEPQLLFSLHKSKEFIDERTEKRKNK
jgi:hypothetical protein